MFWNMLNVGDCCDVGFVYVWFIDEVVFCCWYGI